tara:strand:- start:2798 stop:4708 length:1911 start_codon:yes stop_codon:yes gene_type:complete
MTKPEYPTPNPSKWPPFLRKNNRQRMPWGYKPNPDNDLETLPDPYMIGLLEEVFVHIDNGESYRKSAEWVSARAGKSISYQTISNLWTKSRKRKRNILKKESNKKLAEVRRPKTKTEAKEQEIRKKMSAAKRSMTVSKNKLHKLHEETKDDPETPTINISDTLDHESVPQERTIIFEPNKGPQTEFLASSEREVLFGGAAGGGKSYSLLADPLRYFHNSNFNGLILRRTNDELRELIWKSRELYPLAYPGAKWQEKKSQWVFPSGAKLWLTYLERDEDVLRYQGQAFSYIGFDELTQHPTPFSWNYMRSRLRTTDPELPVFMRATTNPGGPGHQWVKQMFIDPSPANKPFVATDMETKQPMVFPDTHEKAGKPLFYRRFIPATLKDNPYLYDEGTYEANLLSLPEMQRRQLLDGDWSIAEGAAFSEFRANIHTTEPFEIPTDWRRFRSCDYGYSSFSAVHWFAIDPAFSTLYVYRELYLSKHTGRDLAKAVLAAEGSEPIDYGILDSSCWHNRGQLGPSIAEEMISEGCRWRPSDRSAGARVAGKNRFHEVLKVDEDTELPGIIFFNTCRQIIADLPVIPSDPKGGDDIDQRYRSDHTYDSVRYGIMSRPKAFSPFDFGSGVPKPEYRPSDNIFGY